MADSKKTVDVHLLLSGGGNQLVSDWDMSKPNSRGQVSAYVRLDTKQVTFDVPTDGELVKARVEALEAAVVELDVEHTRKRETLLATIQSLLALPHQQQEAP